MFSPKFTSAPSAPRNPAQILQEKLFAIDSKLSSLNLPRQEIAMIPEALKIAWERSQEYLKQRIQLEDFINNPPTKQKALEAKKLVESREKTFRLDREKMYADTLEAIIADEINKKHWFGKGVGRILTSSYDDYKNGADLAIEINTDDNTSLPQPILLSMDVTYSDNPTRIGQKLQKAFEKLQRGELGTIVFYKNATFMGGVSNVPIVTVGVGKATIDDLAKKWIDKDTRSELENHFAQKVILEQTSVQLSAFQTYLSRHQEVPNRDEMYSIITRDVGLLAMVLQEKESVPLGKGSQDPVYTQILALSRQIAKM